MCVGGGGGGGRGWIITIYKLIYELYLYLFFQNSIPSFEISVDSDRLTADPDPHFIFNIINLYCPG